MRLIADWLPVVDTAGMWLSTYLLHSTLLLALALSLARWLGSRQLALQESLLRVAVIGGLLTATLQIGLGWEPAAGTIPYPTTSQSVVRTAVPDEMPAVSARPATLGPSVAAGKMRPIPSGVEGTPDVAAGATTWLWLVVLLWATGAILSTGRLVALAVALGHHLRHRVTIERGVVFRLFWRLLASADIDRPTRLSRSSRLRVPIALGITGREICLPGRVVRELPEEQLETVLAHELAHLERRDPLWLLIVRSIESLLFVQPLNRLARRRLQELAEYGCDDWAARHTGRPDTLARCLTEVATWSIEDARLALAPTMAGRSGLGRRVRRLLAPGYSGAPVRVPGWWRPLAGATLFAVVLAVPGFSALEREQALEEPNTPSSVEAVERAEEVVEPGAPMAPSAEAPGPVLAPVVDPAPGDAVVAVVAPEPSGTSGTSERAVVAVRLAPKIRVVHRTQVRRVVRIAPRVGEALALAPLSDLVATASASENVEANGETALAPADLDSLDEEEVEALEDELDEVLDDLEESVEADLESVLDDLDDEMDARDDRLEESLETRVDDVESELDRELESLEDELERLEEQLEATESERSSESVEAEMERFEDDMDALSEEVDRELDRIERSYERRLGASVDETAVRELEARVDRMTERIEAQSDSLEAMARQMVRDHRAAGETRLSEQDRETLRAEARRLAAEARPSKEEIEALRSAARELGERLEPSREELEAVRQEVESELEALRQRVRTQVDEERRSLERLQRERTEP